MSVSPRESDTQRPSVTPLEDRLGHVIGGGMVRSESVYEIARKVLATLKRDGYALVPVAELYEHADGNVGDGCGALYEKYAHRRG